MDTTTLFDLFDMVRAPPFLMKAHALELTSTHALTASGANLAGSFPDFLVLPVTYLPRYFSVLIFRHVIHPNTLHFPMPAVVDHTGPVT